MIIDARTLESGTEIDTDLCIIGAGPAGISIAREFDGSGVRVCLLESGGHAPDDDTQDLYGGNNVGLPYFDLDATRLRCFGGTSYHWEGWCAPFSEADFVKRDWVPHSGWPISKSDLDPYYRRAETICDLPGDGYGHENWKRLGIVPPEFEPDKLISRFWQFSPPTRFGPKYRSQLMASNNIQVYLNCNVTNLQTNEFANSVDKVDFRGLDGSAGEVTAKILVLACGGLENPRILLTSNNVAKDGIGNEHDLVGRFFMEHPHFDCGDVAATAPIDLINLFKEFVRPTTTYRPALCPSDQVMSEAKILNSSSTVQYARNPDTGIGAMSSMLADIQEGRMPNQLSEKLYTVLSDLDDIAITAYLRFIEGRPGVSSTDHVYLRARNEQAPNPHSRVSLTAERDALGVNRLQLNWRLSELDRHTGRVLARTVGAEFGRLSLGRVKVPDWLLNEGSSWPDNLAGGNHHMGTTRMVDDPKKGVVDKNCRVHGNNNLYIAGSSVFPTSGYANPTLTIVALSLRLADHLKQKFT